MGIHFTNQVTVPPARFVRQKENRKVDLCLNLVHRQEERWKMPRLIQLGNWHDTQKKKYSNCTGWAPLPYQN